ncbi:hypothetical protein H5410_042214, partial [Solanum commersonii]
MEFRCEFCRKFSWTSVKTLVVKPFGPDGQTGPFSRWSRQVNRPIFKIIRALEQTLVIELVSPDGQTDPFSRSNEPRAKLRRDFSRKFSWTSTKALAIEPVGPDGQTDPFL